MIGNDVVDLGLAARQSNWRRKGFLNKVFLKSEQKDISTSANHDARVWLLWSMKEAAYKAHQRQFNLPRKLHWLSQRCEILEQDINKTSGIVRINEEVYHTTSEITSNYIYTSAETDETRGAKSAIFEAPSSEVKRHLFHRISCHFSIDPSELTLEKDSFGMPFFSSEHFYFDRFSLSGHGSYSACVLSLINCETPVKHS